MFIKLFSFLTALMLCFCYSNPAMAEEIRLPAANQLLSTTRLENNFSESDHLQNWTFLRDNVSGVIKKGFGSPIQFPEFKEATEDNVELIADKFFKTYSKEFGIDASSIKMVAKKYANNRWHLKYSQYYHNLKVLFSDISLTIFKNGNIMSVGAEFYNNIDIPTTPKISYKTAVNKASLNSKKQKIRDRLLKAPNLKILPIIKDEQLTYHLVYEHEYETESKDEVMTSMVDAFSGEVLWRYSNRLFEEVSFQVLGPVRERLNSEKTVLKPMTDQEVEHYKKRYYTNEKGEISFEGLGNYSNLSLKGKYVKVFNTAMENATMTVNHLNGKDKFEWWGGVANLAETNLYYHTQVVHKYFKDLDPDQTVLDFPIRVELCYGYDKPNAYSAGSKIVFLEVNNPEYQMPLGGTVLYHEYGHSMNNLLYASLIGDRMKNSSCHEALADITSFAILLEPKIGLGYKVSDPEHFIRNLDNERTYPEDVKGECHYDGQILAGALWDLYKLTDIETLNKVSHFAKYETPDDSNLANAFAEWFFACIIADDDDGDISNGTPHFHEIVTAFNKHKIGLDLLYGDIFSHDPPLLSDNDKDFYPIKFKFKSDQYPGLFANQFYLKDANLIWTTEASNDFDTVKVENLGDGEFLAKIPKQEDGTIISYYFELLANYGDAYKRFVSTKSFGDFDKLFVAYNTDFFDDFETEKHWIYGLDSDNANIGLWERDFLEDNSLLDKFNQPIDDVTEGGKFCLITDNNMIDNKAYGDLKYADGITSVVSPKIDLSGRKKCVVDFYKTILIKNDGEYDTDIYTNLSVSNDNGETWTEVIKITESDTTWKRIYVDISQYIDKLTENMRFKFTAHGKDYLKYSQILETAIDEFRVISALKNPNSVAESNIDVQIYPNPTSSHITFEMKDVPESIDIYDMLGNLVYSNDKLLSKTFVWDLVGSHRNKIDTGVYIIKIRYKSEVKTYKIVLQ